MSEINIDWLFERYYDDNDQELSEELINIVNNLFEVDLYHPETGSFKKYKEFFKYAAMGVAGIALAPVSLYALGYGAVSIGSSLVVGGLATNKMIKSDYENKKSFELPYSKFNDNFYNFLQFTALLN